MDQELLEKIMSIEAIPNASIETAQQQFNPLTHEINNRAKRPDKIIQVPTGLMDSDGNDIMTSKTVFVARQAYPIQKLITKRRKAFMNLSKAELYTDSEDTVLLEMVKKVRKDNKYSFKINEIATAQMSELQAAELWYVTEDSQVKMQVLKPSNGDQLIPVFDRFGDMTYFARVYQSVDGVSEPVNRVDVYTKENIYRFADSGAGFVLELNIPNQYGKIPVIYYSQPTAEWADVQPIIERLETLMSNFADTNDYNGSPITVVNGNVKGFATKGESGKMIELEPDASISYLTWDQAPEAIKLELDQLLEMIYTCSQTPNITFKEMGGLGVSGEAFDRVFIDAQLAAQDKLDGGFGECLQRSVNLVADMCRFAYGIKEEDAEIEVEVPAFKLNSVSDTIKVLLNATGGEAVISRESAVKMAATLFGLNPEDEWEKANEINIEQLD